MQPLVCLDTVNFKESVCSFCLVSMFGISDVVYFQILVIVHTGSIFLGLSATIWYKFFDKKNLILFEESSHYTCFDCFSC